MIGNIGNVLEGNQEGKERKELGNVILIVEGKDRNYNFSAT